MKPKGRASRLYVAAITVGLLIFSVTAVIARHGIQPWEERLFFAIFNWPNGLRWPFLIVTQFGNATAILAAVALSYLSRFRTLAWRFLLTGASAYAIVTLTKDLVNRARPFTILSGVHERELMVSGKGFPSGHTAVATALALTLVVHLPKNWRWLPVLWIVSVGVSRIYLGVHAPLDIMGGFGIGLMVSASLHFFVNTDRKLRKTSVKR